MLPAQFPSYDSWEILIKIGMIIIFPRKNGLPIYTTFFGHTPLNKLGNPPIKNACFNHRVQEYGLLSRSTMPERAWRVHAQAVKRAGGEGFGVGKWPKLLQFLESTVKVSGVS